MKKQMIHISAVVIFAMLLTGKAYAANWSSTKSVNVTTTYTDNTSLAADNNAESDTLVEVRPSVGIKGEGGRLKLNLNYALGAVFSDGGNNRDDFEDSHFLNATANIEAIEDNLFIDVSANAGITSVSSSGRIAPDIYTQSDNTTQTYSFSVSPYARYHFGQYADALLRVSADALNNDSGDNDSDNTSISLSISSGDYFRAYDWKVTATQSWLEYENDNEDESSLIKADFSYRINRKFTADFGIGYETNDYQNTLSDYSDTDGVIWDVGTTWTPNSRTTLKLSYGDRFFGEDWMMDFKYRHKKSTLTASYATTATNSRSERLDSLSSLNLNDDPFFNPDNYDRLLPSIDDEIIIQNRFRLAYQYSSRRTTLGLDASYAERDYQESGDETEDLSTSLSLSRKITPATSLTSRLSWVSREDITADSDEDLITLRVGMNTSLGAKSKLSIDVQRSENEDSAGVDDYEENRISATLGMTF